MSLNDLDSILDSIPKELPKENKLDYYNLSYKGTSYSRSLTLHSCPRKFELDSKFNIKKRRNSVTFAYGHAMGEGIQAALSGATKTQALVATILAYDFDEEDEGTTNEKAAKKSIWWAVQSVALFADQYLAGIYSFLDGWEVPSFEFTQEDGTKIFRKAAELSFVIDCTEGYTHEGHIDLVLHKPATNRYMVLELKTTGMSVVDQASYKNSAQALGYGVVVDAIANNIKASASFDVLYMVYKSRSHEIVPMVFTKSPLMRAQWLNSLVSDIQFIEQCEASGYYPHRGESCFNYFRECEYMLNECHMSNEMLAKAYGEIGVLDTKENGDAQFSKMERPDFFFHIGDLAKRQAQLVDIGNNPEATDPDLLLDITTIG